MGGMYAFLFGSLPLPLLPMSTPRASYQLTPIQRLNFPDSEYATTPLAPAPSDSTSSSSSSSSSSSIDGIRVFPHKIPSRRPLPGSQHPRVCTPSTPATSTSGTTNVNAIAAADQVAEVDEGEANCYDANHNKFMYLTIGTGPDCDGYVLTFCFPYPLSRLGNRRRERVKRRLHHINSDAELYYSPCQLWR